MSTNDSNVRVPLDGTYGYGSVTAKPIQFVGEVGRSPKAHVPGQPVVRVEGQLEPTRQMERTASFENRIMFQPLNSGGDVMRAPVPQLATELSAGYDLVCPVACRLEPGERRAI